MIDSPVGDILLVARESGLTHLLFSGGRMLSANSPTPARGDDSAAATHILAAATQQLHEYFTEGRRQFEVPLAPRGTEFQLAVWRRLRDIPFGKTVSYGDIAAGVGRPRAVRAVGAANGANPISIIVPCHRVIGHDRRLTGYGGGMPTKRRLLELEGMRFEGERVV